MERSSAATGRGAHLGRTPVASGACTDLRRPLARAQVPVRGSPHRSPARSRRRCSPRRHRGARRRRRQPGAAAPRPRSGWRGRRRRSRIQLAAGLALVGRGRAHRSPARARRWPARCSPRSPGWRCTRCPSRPTAPRCSRWRWSARASRGSPPRTPRCCIRAGAPAGALDRVGGRGRLRRDSLLGLLPALVFDPRRSGCFACPDNLLLVARRPRRERTGSRAGRRARRPRRRSRSPRSSPRGCCGVPRPPRARSPRRSPRRPWSCSRCRGELARNGLAATTGSLWLATCAALGLLAGGLAWRPLRARRPAPPSARSPSPPRRARDDVRGALGRRSATRRDAS